MSNLIPVDRELLSKLIEEISSHNNQEVSNIKMSELLDMYPYNHREIIEIQEDSRQRVISETNDILRSIRNRQEKYLEMIFSGISDSFLKTICATAEQIDKELTGGVYFIKNEYNGMIKIGCTDDIGERFSQIKSGFTHLGMEPKLELIGMVLVFPKYKRQVENDFHQMFKCKREIGEWFNITKEEVYDQILSETDKFEFINDVLIDYTDYERDFFKNITRDYKVTEHEIREKVGIKNEVFSLESVFTKKNELLNVLVKIEEAKIGFHDAEYFSSSKGRIIGIKHIGSNVTLDFQGLKISKFNSTNWKGIVKSLQIGARFPRLGITKRAGKDLLSY